MVKLPALAAAGVVQEREMADNDIGRLAVLWRGDREARRSATPQNNRFYRVFEELAALGVHAEPAVYDEDFADEDRADDHGADHVGADHLGADDFGADHLGADHLGADEHGTDDSPGEFARDSRPIQVAGL